MAYRTILEIAARAGAVLLCQICMAQVAVTINPQQSPFPLPAGVTLFSAQACSEQPSNRTITAGQISQIATGAGIAMQDPALNATMLSRTVARDNRVLDGTKWGAAAISITAAAIAAFKNSNPNVGNAQTWAIVSGGTGAFAAGVPILESFLSQKAAADATITTGVASALIGDMTSLYSVPQGSCAKTVMFFGEWPSNKHLQPIQGVIQ